MSLTVPAKPGWRMSAARNAFVPGESCPGSLNATSACVLNAATMYSGAGRRANSALGVGAWLIRSRQTAMMHRLGIMRLSLNLKGGVRHRLNEGSTSPASRNDLFLAPTTRLFRNSDEHRRRVEWHLRARNRLRGVGAPDLDARAT